MDRLREDKKDITVKEALIKARRELHYNNHVLICASCNEIIEEEHQINSIEDLHFNYLIDIEEK